MNLVELVSALDLQLTDAHVLAAVYQTNYDAETIVFARDVEIHLLDKALVVDRRDGSYFARSPLETSRISSRSHALAGASCCASGHSSCILSAGTARCAGRFSVASTPSRASGSA